MSWNWTYLIPIVYLIVMVAVGVMVSKTQKTRSDFYVASNKMNTGVLFATIFSTVVGANTYMGFSGMIYSNGFSRAWYLVGAGFAYFLLFYISGKLRRIAAQHEVFTLPDMMELRYSRPVALVTTIFSLVSLIGGAGGSILGIGVILHSVLGINTTLAIIITSVVTIIYTTFGGLMGVALTDWIQSMIMILGLILIIVFGLMLVTDNPNFFSAAFHASDHLSKTLGHNYLTLTQGVTFLMIVGWAITFMPLNTISQTQIQRVYAAKSEKIIQRISLTMALFIIMFAFGLSLVGALGKLALPGLHDPETVFPVMALKIVNPVVGMIIVTGILSACMSTVSGNLLGAGINVSRDLYERYKKGTGQPIDEKSALTVTRITLIVIGVLSTVAAIVTPSIMDLLLVTMHIFAGATFIPILCGLYWKRANSVGAMSGMVFGGASTIFAEIFQTPLDPVIVGILFSIIGIVLGSLVTQPEVQKAKVFEFHSKKDIPFFILFAVLVVLFIMGMANVKLWGILIIATVLALIFSIVMLLIYMFPKSKDNKVR